MDIKLIKILGFTLSLLLAPVVSAAELKAFTSDGCSAFPDGTFEQNELWLSCCVAHDFSYWKGGTAKERKASDVALKQCVESVGEEEIAILMLAGVRVGGSPYFPTTFRWGYGWPYPKFYEQLTAEEIDQVNEQIDNLDEEFKKYQPLLK